MMFTGFLNTLTDVEAFIAHLVTVHKLNFHPDTSFEDYISIATSDPSFTPADAARYNALMETAFAVCEKEGVDIYALGLEQLKAA